MQVRSFADLQQRHQQQQQQHQQQLNKTNNNLQNFNKNCDVKTLNRQQNEKNLEEEKATIQEIDTNEI